MVNFDQMIPKIILPWIMIANLIHYSEEQVAKLIFWQKLFLPFKQTTSFLTFEICLNWRGGNSIVDVYVFINDTDPIRIE